MGPSYLYEGNSNARTLVFKMKCGPLFITYIAWYLFLNWKQGARWPNGPGKYALGQYCLAHLLLCAGH